MNQTISRQVRAGKIPAMQRDDGRRLIDPAAADSARRRNGNIAAGHGGRPDRALRRAIQFRARADSGFTPEHGAMLSAMRSRWPALVKDTMLALGATELDAAKGVIVVRELVESMAIAIHQEFNVGRAYDYRARASSRAGLER